MKLYFKVVLVALLISGGNAFSQVGMTNNNPDKSAVLDLNESNKGLLIPRIFLSTTSDVDVINGKAPANSLLIYNTNDAISGTGTKGKGFYYWDGAISLWKRIITIADTTAWALDGNKNIVEKKLGTLDSIDLPVVVNNIERMRIKSRTDTTFINLGINKPARLSFGHFAFSNVKTPHISLSEDGTTLYGFGVTPGQLNYLSNDIHAINVGGANPIEEVRIQAGNNTNKSSLRITHIPEGGHDDRVLVDRNNEVYSTSSVFKFEIQSGVASDTLKASLGESNIQDMIYVRMERTGYYGVAVFSITRSAIDQGNNRNFFLTYLYGGVEPVADNVRKDFVVTNVNSPAGMQPNHLKLTFPNAPNTFGTTDGFDFEIWITADATAKTLNIKNLTTFDNPSWYLSGSRKFYITQIKGF